MRRLFILLIVLTLTYSAAEINSCKTIDKSGDYSIIKSLSSEDTCLIITAPQVTITLDGGVVKGAIVSYNSNLSISGGPVDTLIMNGGSLHYKGLVKNKLVLNDTLFQLNLTEGSLSPEGVYIQINHSKGAITGKISNIREDGLTLFSIVNSTVKFSSLSIVSVIGKNALFNFTNSTLSIYQSAFYNLFGDVHVFKGRNGDLSLIDTYVRSNIKGVFDLENVTFYIRGGDVNNIKPLIIKNAINQSFTGQQSVVYIMDSRNISLHDCSAAFVYSEGSNFSINTCYLGGSLEAYNSILSIIGLRQVFSNAFFNNSAGSIQRSCFGGEEPFIVSTSPLSLDMNYYDGVEELFSNASLIDTDDNGLGDAGEYYPFGIKGNFVSYGSFDYNPADASDTGNCILKDGDAGDLNMVIHYNCSTNVVSIETYNVVVPVDAVVRVIGANEPYESHEVKASMGRVVIPLTARGTYRVSAAFNAIYAEPVVLNALPCEEMPKVNLSVGEDRIKIIPMNSLSNERVTFKVEYANGKAAKNLPLTLHTPFGSLKVVSDENGFFTVDLLSNGKYYFSSSYIIVEGKAFTVSRENVYFYRTSIHVDGGTIRIFPYVSGNYTVTIYQNNASLPIITDETSGIYAVDLEKGEYYVEIKSREPIKYVRVYTSNQSAYDNISLGFNIFLTTLIVLAIAAYVYLRSKPYVVLFEDEGNYIKATIRDYYGRPLVNKRVKVFWEGEKIADALTDERGSIIFQAKKRGAYWLGSKGVYFKNAVFRKY